MSTILFRTASLAIVPVLLLLSVVVLLRGHNEPGGGFVGGLMAASALAIYALAVDFERARAMLRVHPTAYIGAGLLAAAVSGFPALLFGDEFLTGEWMSLPVFGFAEPVKVGTPVLFDIGVYMVVFGSVLLMVFTLVEVLRDAADGRSPTTARPTTPRSPRCWHARWSTPATPIAPRRSSPAERASSAAGRTTCSSAVTTRWWASPTRHAWRW